MAKDKPGLVIVIPGVYELVVSGGYELVIFGVVVADGLDFGIAGDKWIIGHATVV